MPGVNRKFLNESRVNARKRLGYVCIFISHQKKDKDACKKIADYIKDNGIDVYFDEYDKDLKKHYQDNNPKGVTNAIIKGIRASSHMLVVVSQNTLNSRWVPFEIGYGYDDIKLRVLTLKGIPKGTLPSYIRTVPIIRDIYDLNNLIARLADLDKRKILLEHSIKSYKSKHHELRNVMDSIKHDTY